MSVVCNFQSGRIFFDFKICQYMFSHMTQN